MFEVDVDMEFGVLIEMKSSLKEFVTFGAFLLALQGVEQELVSKLSN